jgi:hypothetical protein
MRRTRRRCNIGLRATLLLLILNVVCFAQTENTPASSTPVGDKPLTSDERSELLKLIRNLQERLEKLEALGYGKLPVCIEKTQYSFTDDQKQFGAPVGWTLTISDVTLSAGAGFVVAIAGEMVLMPGLGKVPQAQKLDVDDQGRAIGMDY